MDRLIETLSTFFEKRIRSPFWMYFLIVLIFHLRKEIYVTLFVDESILYRTTGQTLVSFLKDPFANYSGLIIELIGYAFLAWAIGTFFSSLLAWVNKGWDGFHLSVTNWIEKNWVLPKMVERLRMQEEYKEISRFRQEGELFSGDMSKEFRDFKNKIYDGLEELRKVGKEQEAWRYQQRMEKTVRKIRHTTFYATNGASIDTEKENRRLLEEEAVIRSGRVTEYGLDLIDQIERLKKKWNQ